jgi:hypothetical protein
MRMRIPFLTFEIMVSMLFGLGSLVYAIATCQHINRSLELRESGQPVAGTVDDVFGKIEDEKPRYYYRYAVGGKEYRIGPRSIPRSEARRIVPGMVVMVWYDPLKPSRNMTNPELAEIEWWPPRILIPACSLACLAYGFRRLAQRVASLLAKRSA